jgi:hypothetical protein
MEQRPSHHPASLINASCHEKKEEEEEEEDAKIISADYSHEII